MTGRSLMQIAGAPLFAVSLWFGLSWIPSQSTSVARLDKQAEADKAQVLADLEVAGSIPAIESRLNRRIEITERAVPPAADLAQFIADTGDAAILAGVLIDQIAPLSVGSGDDPENPLALPAGTSSILLSVGATGSYQNLLGFVDDMTGGDRLVLIDFLDLNSDEAASAQVTMDLELRIFTTADLVPQPPADPGPATDPAVSAP